MTPTVKADKPSVGENKPGRLGPRPLAFHLAMAGATWMTSRGALPNWKQGSLPWLPDLQDRAAALHEAILVCDETKLSKALQGVVAERGADLIRAIQAYWAHPYQRDAVDPPLVWQAGTTRLLDYRAHKKKANAWPLLVVPSLINRYYIVDLKPDSSFLRWLAVQGFDPFVVDWDAPGPKEAGFDLQDYIGDRLGAALDQVLAESGRRPQVLGYCMGGLLALGLAQQRAKDLAGLVLMATPWDFHAEGDIQGRILSASLVSLGPMMEMLGHLPVEVIQTLFSGLDPLLAVRKFQAFGRLDPASLEAETFVALEDWLNDGVPLVKAVARECLAEWYGRNSAAEGAWCLAGDPVRPESINLPSLCVVPSRDRIVPPASARALGHALPQCETLERPAGHIGMMVGRDAAQRTWLPIAEWLKAQPTPARAGRGGASRAKSRRRAAPKRTRR